MADVIYKKGQSINLDNVEIADGQILVTEDTGEMYIDMSDGTRKKISDNNKQEKFGEYNSDESVITASSNTLTLKDSAGKGQLTLTPVGPVLVANDGSVSIVAGSTSDDNGTTFSVQKSHLQVDCPEHGRPIHGVVTLTQPDPTLGDGRFSTEESLRFQAASKEYVDDTIVPLNDKVNSLISGGLTREIVDILPKPIDGGANTIYMVKKTDTNESNNVYEEYIKVITFSGNYGVSTGIDQFYIDGSTVSASEFMQFTWLISSAIDNDDGTTTLNLVSTSMNMTSSLIIDMSDSSYTASDIVVESAVKFTNIMNDIYIVKLQILAQNWELIGSTEVDLSGKQDSFATVTGNSIILDSDKNSIISITNFELNANGNFDIRTSDSNGGYDINIESGKNINIQSAGNTYIHNNTTLLGNLDFGNGNGCITNLGTPANDTDAVNKGYIDNVADNKMDKFGTVGSDGFVNTTNNTFALRNAAGNASLIMDSTMGVYINSPSVISLNGTRLNINSQIDVNSKQIKNVADPTDRTDAVNKSYVDSLGAVKGSTLTVGAPTIRSGIGTSKLELHENETTLINTKGSVVLDAATHISANNKQIKKVAAPTDGTDAVNKAYVDALITRIQKLENAIIALGGTIEE